MENNKEELKKLEFQYNKYMKIMKVVLLIIIITFFIIATRYIYCFSLAYKIIHANNIDILDKNLKMTYFMSFQDDLSENNTITHYYKDGVTVMEASFFKSYSINGKNYNFYPYSKTYSVHDLDKIETWDDFSFSRKVATIAVYATTFFTTDIDHEKIDGIKYLVFSDEYNKTYYDAKTYLQTRKINSNSTTDIKYEFDAVIDKDITLPDLNEYTLEKD